MVIICIVPKHTRTKGVNIRRDAARGGGGVLNWVKRRAMSAALGVMVWVKQQAVEYFSELAARNAKYFSGLPIRRPNN